MNALTDNLPGSAFQLSGMTYQALAAARDEFSIRLCFLPEPNALRLARIETPPLEQLN